VLHFFTGTHGDYHKPSDTADKINAAGAGQIATLVADLAARVAGHEGALTLKKVPMPLCSSEVVKLRTRARQSPRPRGWIAAALRCLLVNESNMMHLI
jgi:hypothetical protein